MKRQNNIRGLAVRVRTIIVAAICPVFFSGCSSTAVVKPVDAKAHKVEWVCIVKNPKVWVADMEEVLESGFLRHGICTELYEESLLPANCDYTLRYTARKEWDFATFLAFAQLEIYHAGRVIAAAEYDHSGFDMSKWGSTASKVDPLIDELLIGFQGPSTSAGPGKCDNAMAIDQKNDVYTQLLKLDELRQKGIITQAEFDEQKQKILASTN